MPCFREQGNGHIPIHNQGSLKNFATMWQDGGLGNGLGSKWGCKSFTTGLIRFGFGVFMHLIIVLITFDPSDPWSNLCKKIRGGKMASQVNG